MRRADLCRGAAVTSARRPQEKLIQAQQTLGKVLTVVMDLTDEPVARKLFAGLRQVGHGLISAGIHRNGEVVKNDL
jgi:hypothetical protein